MNFYKKEKSPEGTTYPVYMQLNNKEHYVCDMADASNVSLNELGLTLRARLTRSKGKYAMLEGTIFSPIRLLDAACEITAFNEEAFIGGDYKEGYTLLSVTADGCVNKYLIFDKPMLDSLIRKIEKRVKNK